MPDRFANGDRATVWRNCSTAPTHASTTAEIFGRRRPVAGTCATWGSTIWLTPVYDNADFSDPQRRFACPSLTTTASGAVDFAVDERLATWRGCGAWSCAHAAASGDADRWRITPARFIRGSPIRHAGLFHGTRGETFATVRRGALIDPRTTAAVRTRCWTDGSRTDLNQDDPRSRGTSFRTRSGGLA
jgi:hypothetical protein